MKPSSVLRLLALLSANFGAIALATPDPARLGRELSAPHAAVLREGADAVAAHVAAAALWCALCWLAIGLTAALLACLPGSVGAVAQRASRVLLPGVLRRFVAGAAGLSVLVAPVSALAQPAPGPLPSPLLPSSAPLSVTHLPAPVIPSHRAASPQASAPASVVVRPGDSLWVIAARSLGDRATPATIAACWPTWYAANRSVIGDDPSHLVPGQVLQQPGTAVMQ